MITEKVQILTVKDCQCDGEHAKYDANGLCLKCHLPRPTWVKVYDCPAGCDKGIRGGRECAVCEGRGYIA